MSLAPESRDGGQQKWTLLRDSPLPRSLTCPYQGQSIPQWLGSRPCNPSSKDTHTYVLPQVENGALL